MANEGAVDLVGVAMAETEQLEPLDPEVRADVLEAARLLQVIFLLTPAFAFKIQCK